MKNKMMKSAIIIPARYASTRLPRKMLLNETGKPLLQHTYESALKATLPNSVTIACDHEEIFHAVQQFGGRAVMTNPNAQSGTDRIAEVAAALEDIEIIVNVQGDEPEIAGAAIDLVVQMLIDHPDAVMSTAAAPLRNRKQLEDPSCVKVVCDKNGRALYFSRSIIPHPRLGLQDEQLAQSPSLFYQHMGLYAYRREFLQHLRMLLPTELEKAESLEQLRVLYHGYSILVGITDDGNVGIDTPEDYQSFVERWRKKEGLKQ